MTAWIGMLHEKGEQAAFWPYLANNIWHCSCAAASGIADARYAFSSSQVVIKTAFAAAAAGMQICQARLHSRLFVAVVGWHCTHHMRHVCIARSYVIAQIRVHDWMPSLCHFSNLPEVCQACIMQAKLAAAWLMDACLQD